MRDPGPPSPCRTTLSTGFIHVVGNGHGARYGAPNRARSRATYIDIDMLSWRLPAAHHLAVQQLLPPAPPARGARAQRDAKVLDFHATAIRHPDLTTQHVHVSPANSKIACTRKLNALPIRMPD